MSNKVKVEITGYAPNMMHDLLGHETSELSRNIKLKRELQRVLRTATKIGDTEVINHTMLGRLRDTGIQFNIVK